MGGGGARLLFGKFDFLQVIFSVNVDLGDVATESEQGPDREKRSFKQRTNWGRTDLWKVSQQNTSRGY